jgi:hypothetical protein
MVGAMERILVMFLFPVRLIPAAVAAVVMPILRQAKLVDLVFALSDIGFDK